MSFAYAAQHADAPTGWPSGWTVPTVDSGPWPPGWGPNGSGGTGQCGSGLKNNGALLCVCWDGSIYTNSFGLPAGISGYPYCAFKSVDPCAGGANPGFMYRWDCASRVWRATASPSDCTGNDLYYAEGIPPTYGT